MNNIVVFNKLLCYDNILYGKNVNKKTAREDSF